MNRDALTRRLGLFVFVALTIAACAAPAGSPTSPASDSPSQQASKSATPSASAAIAFPEGETITMIVPWDAGGATDVGARILAPALEKSLGTTLDVVNRGGAGSQVGVTELAQATPDGLTIGFTNLPSSMVPYLDPDRNAAYGRASLVQIANHVFDPEVLAVRADSPFATLEDFLEAARARPGEVSIAVAGIGSDGHLGFLVFQDAADIELKQVSTEGTPESFQQVLGGHVDGAIMTLGNFGSQLESGEFRFLGVMDGARSEFIPDVPTFEEQGVAGALMASTRGISAPAGVPAEIVDALGAAVAQAMESDEVKQRMGDLALGQRYMDPKEYAAYWDAFESTAAPLLELIKNQQ